MEPVVWPKCPAGEQRLVPAPTAAKVTSVIKLTNAAEDGCFQRARADEASARLSFCRLTTGYRATAVTMPARATMISR